MGVCLCMPVPVEIRRQPRQSVLASNLVQSRVSLLILAAYTRLAGLSASGDISVSSEGRSAGLTGLHHSAPKPAFPSSGI